MGEWTCRYCHTSNQAVWGDCSGCSRARDVFTPAPEPTTTAEAPTTTAEPAPYNPIQGSAGAAFRPQAPGTAGWSTPQSPTPAGWTPPAPGAQPQPWPQPPAQGWNPPAQGWTPPGQPGQPGPGMPGQPGPGMPGQPGPGMPGLGFGNTPTVGVFRPTAYCPACGGIIDAEAEICPRCGSRLRTATAPGVVFSVLAIFCGIFGFLFLPIVFGPIGVALALAGRNRGERYWRIGLMVAFWGAIIGWVVGMAFSFMD